MAQPRFRYLVFLDSNGYILLDIDMPHTDAPPFIKDTVLEMWNNENETWARNDLSVLGPLVHGEDDETARNAHRSAGHMTKLVGNDLESVTQEEWKAFFEVLHPEIWEIP